MTHSEYSSRHARKAWADRLGFESVTLSEHHASPDGYMPSPIVMASAIGARTRRLRIMISLIFDAVVDPLIGVWSDNSPDRTVVVAVYGQPG